MVKPSYSTSEVAAFCHVTSDTIRKWTETGKLVAFKTPGGHRRIRKEELLRFMQDHDMPIPRELRGGESIVLLISQDSALLSQIERFLERANVGFIMQVARDVFEAGIFVARNLPDVAIIDFSLHGVDGVDLCRKLREVSEGKSVRVIGVVAQDQLARLHDTAMQEVAWLKKEFMPDDLRRVFALIGIEVN